ncbi:uncharacterized protein PHALS_04518 [Plasmopara halstedii]|uniref:Uncharacterized protein n=1 Tax=Plasmopara halstedii TaxID=4781 RepID=A0A0P1A925_PLAHL|nr:uncharacterized protein PHALS_04518 [Plasmopara halstedii]CEG37056.1 hypothetical protein PHALS_04518 [Plasmopara halstedii]|eukprot:XP_024573425.1 hypothetical protein PHALS_04518 [Plasmopara halstedii]
MGLRLFGVVSVTLLLLLVLAIVRLVVLLVQLLTFRYTIIISTVAFICWFVDSRRRRYARGFYSCSRIPQTTMMGEEREIEDYKVWLDRQDEFTTFESPSIALEAPGAVSNQFKKMIMAPPSETESEDDESESGRVVNVNEMPVSAPSLRPRSFLDVRSRSSNTECDLQLRDATRPRSSSAAGNSKFMARKIDANSINHVAEGRERRVPRRRADTGTVSNANQSVRSRRATFVNKPDAHALRNSSSAKHEDTPNSDGYWIGDFRVQRIVPRRSHAINSKTNKVLERL